MAFSGFYLADSQAFFDHRPWADWKLFEMLTLDGRFTFVTAGLVAFAYLENQLLHLIPVQTGKDIILQ